MIEHKKLIVFEIVSIIFIVLIISLVLFVDINLGFFKIVSTKTLIGSLNVVKEAENNYNNKKIEYETTIKNIESLKSQFSVQKSKYDAITDETVDIIKQATTSEKYNIEYMWVKLGNYARSNNLELSMLEPGANPVATEDSKKTTTNTVTSNTTVKTEVKDEKTTTNKEEVPTVTTSDELVIKVKGSYLNVSDFIFDIENDKELRFKLDKIKMESAGSNMITATFSVKNLIFNK
jgi:hypothetical protein